MRIERVQLVVRGDAAHADGVAREGLRREFPSAPVEWVERPDVDAVVLDAAAWNDDAPGFGPFDRAMVAGFGPHAGDEGASRPLAIQGPPASLLRLAEQVLTRYQRFVRRRNPASSGPAFQAVLARHRALHDLSKPLVSADFDHALDTWHWTLRLDPRAEAPVQLAALFHDVERLRTEADARREHHALDYQAFKDAHARAGGEMTHAILREAGIEPKVAERAAWLVAHHERATWPDPTAHARDRGGDPELALLNDADGLSFFSLNSAGYLAYFGPAQTAAKVRYTLGRLTPAARARLPRLRYCAEVARTLHAELSCDRGHADAVGARGSAGSRVAVAARGTPSGGA